MTRMTVPIPCYIAHPTSQTNGENVRWRAGQKARFTGNTGRVSIVTIMTGEPVSVMAAPGTLCMEVTFDEENDEPYCVRASQLRIV